MAKHFWLSAAQFARLQPLLPNKVRGVPRVDERRVISGIIHVLQSGCRWRDAPPVYGPSKTFDKVAYRARNVIERTCCRLKDWRRIATRYDKLAHNYLASVALAAIVLYWL